MLITPVGDARTTVRSAAFGAAQQEGSDELIIEKNSFVFTLHENIPNVVILCFR